MTAPASDSNHGRARGRGRPKRQTDISQRGTTRKRKKSQRTDPDASSNEKPQKTPSPSLMSKKQLYQHHKNMEAAHRTETENLRQELERCQEFQSAYLSLCGTLDGGVMDDEKIRTLFSGSRELRSSWVRRFSSSGPLTHDDELAIKNSNPTAMNESDLESIFAALRGEGYGKNIVLHSFLSHFICQHIIDHPFFFLGPLGNPPSGQCGGNVEESLWKLVQSCPNELKNDSLHAWVYDTLYLLQPSFYKGKTEQPEWATKCRENFYRNATDLFLTGTPAALLKPGSGKEDMKERFDELEAAIRASGELVLKLRDQKVGICHIGRNSQKMMKMKFQRNSVFMEPHPGMLLGPRDNRLDGKTIGFFVEPAIIADWVDKETRTRRQKFWSKAVVWVAGREQAFQNETPVANDSSIDLDPVMEDRSSRTTDKSRTQARPRNSRHSSDRDVVMSDLPNDVEQHQQEATSPSQALKTDCKGTNSKENEMEYTVDSDDQPVASKIQGSHPRADSTPLKMGHDFLGKESGIIEGQRISTSPNQEPTLGTENKSSHRATEDAPSIKEGNPLCEEFRRSTPEHEGDDGSSEGSEKIQASPPEETRIATTTNVEKCDRSPVETSDKGHSPGFGAAQKEMPDKAQGICDTTGAKKTPTAAVSHDKNCSCSHCHFSDWVNPNSSPQSHHAAVIEAIPNQNRSIHPQCERDNASTASDGDATNSNNDAYKKERSKEFWKDLSNKEEFKARLWRLLELP
ncbi:hypothetical protein FQN53_002887 [Emmonsiellopsis sp. PD_33]|nr:hypothetical protein FQN53_002887 [Emmonsiellopsis sp. PD_33]